MRNRLWAARTTAALVFRVWRLHRRTGIPFRPLLEAHLQALDFYRTALEQAVAELAATATPRTGGGQLKEAGDRSDAC